MNLYSLTLLCSFALLPLAWGQSCSLKEHGKDISSPNIRNVSQSPESSCCYHCGTTANCVAYAWNNYNGGTCWLKGSAGPIVDNGEVTVGFMDGAASSFRVVAFWRGTWDVAHISFANEANRYFPTIQNELNFVYEATTDWSRINDNYLANVDVILFLDDKPTDSNHKAVVQRFVERGGGFMAFHVTAFTTNANEWSWYHNTFLGSGNFFRNTWRPTPATLTTEDRNHPVTKNLPATWRSQHNEWYAWSNDLRNNQNINILLSINPSSFPLGTDPNQSFYDGYYPVVWTNKNYRMLYCNMGHNDIDYNGNIDLSETFGGETQNRFFKDALLWLSYRDSSSKLTPPLFRAFGAQI